MASTDERKELLAAVHEHLLQNGFQKAARELLLQSGQKTFSPCPVPLKDIFAQWKKTSLQTQKPGTPVKVRVPDPQSSSESSEEEAAAAAKPIKANLPVNNSSIAKGESSSEDEDSSSEEEAAPSKMVKAPLTENKASGCLQLAAQKSNSFPGKGVAIAAVQAKGQQNKVVSNKQPTPAAPKAGQNRNLFGKSTLQSSVGAGQNTAQAKKGANSESSSSNSSSSSSSSESEEDKTKPVVKSPFPTPAVKKAESSSEDSSDSSEEETKVAAPQTKSAAPSAQVSLTPAKGISDTAVPLKGNAGKALSTKKAGSQTTAQSGLVARSTKPTDSTESSSSSDSEAEKPPSVTQAKLPGKSTSTFTPAKSTLLSVPSNKSASVQSPLKSTPKPSVSNLPRLTPSAKSVGTTKKAGSSESSESSSESEDDSPSIPVSQKRLQAVHASSEAKESQTKKAGSPAKAASGPLKGKKTESETSSSSDSEDETISASRNLPPPAATKGNAAAQVGGATKAQGPPGSLQKTQESEDSSQDSSEESESEEETVFTQKPSQLTQKPASIPTKNPVAKTVGATTKKAGGAQPTGKGAPKPAKPAGPLQTISDSGTSDSSEDKGAAGKSVKQPPIHHFFQQKTGKATIASKKGIQANSNPPNSISSSCQSSSTGTMEKVEQNPSKKAKLSQEPRPPPPPAVTPKAQESSGSSSSSDSEEEPYMGTGAIQIPQLASTSIPQKPGLVKKTESSSEESSAEDQEPSQSLLTGGSSQFKTPTSILAKNASVLWTSKASGKASASTVTPVISNLVKSGQTAASSSSSGSSDSDTDIEEMVGQQKDTGTLLSSEKETGGAKGAVASKLGLLSSGSKASLGKKASTKTQSNGKAKETPLALPSKEQVLPQVPGTEGDTVATTLFAAVKNPKNQKSTKKRKLGAEDGGLGEPKVKKLKEQLGPDVPKKLKKKKKNKTSGKTLKKKEGKAKKSDKKKKESKKLASSAADGSQKKKKKKKKKKAGDLGGAA